MKVIVTNSNVQQRIATEKSGLYNSTKFHIVQQNTSNNKIHSK